MASGVKPNKFNSVSNTFLIKPLMDSSVLSETGHIFQKFIVKSAVIVLGGAFSLVETIVWLALTIISSPLLLSRFIGKSAKKVWGVPQKLFGTTLINFSHFLRSLFLVPEKVCKK